MTNYNRFRFRFLSFALPTNLTLIILFTNLARIQRYNTHQHTWHLEISSQLLAKSWHSNYSHQGEIQPTEDKEPDNTQCDT